MNTRPPRALIAEDEPLLALALQQLLGQLWPQLQIEARVADGISAVQQALERLPDLLFLDIRMPGQTGLEAAAEIADAWPEEQALPAIVFVTAYDQYALAAFEACAMDYVLKPVQAARLGQTVQRLQQWWQQRQPAQDTDLAMHNHRQLEQLLGLQQQLLGQGPAALQIIQASVGNQIHMVRVQDIVYLEAADKYLRVLTASQEYLIRTPLKDLLPQLDAQQFWQIHRGTVVRAQAIASAQRDESGRLSLLLRERPEKLAVSRLYATRFRAM
ncbi:LytR/AlgR family response regulator transcription factor [Comamonas testosteroni]|mgnify:FL=1|uniref:LytR/AlgR family response regulator transcription factor n=1 Tax=Comamonas testosteroni TaxID=285 RepID=UPI00265F4C4B|nr:LytTR family DNA-binding domain-containing protein [Comamonas testosteroni]WKL14633.1 LytTR family DNA-binding domain-containing protein [Comamonas testosteroni]WQD41906.1 LytTR family DNA-binding domain-containing protein [Comamonas testosteroni]